MSGPLYSQGLRQVVLLVESLQLWSFVCFYRLHTSLAVDTVFDYSSVWLDFVFSTASHRASTPTPTPAVSLISVLIALKLLEVFFRL